MIIGKEYDPQTDEEGTIHCSRHMGKLLTTDNFLTMKLVGRLCRTQLKRKPTVKLTPVLKLTASPFILIIKSKVNMDSIFIVYTRSLIQLGTVATSNTYRIQISKARMCVRTHGTV